MTKPVSTSRDEILEIIRDLRVKKYPLPETEKFIEGDVLICQNVLSLVPRGSKILDIGCGSLRKTVILQRLGYQCTAVDDFNDEWCSKEDHYLKLVAVAEKIGVEVVRSDAASVLSFPQESFDAITFFNVIEHFHDSPRPYLKKLNFVLKNSGFVIISIPNAVSIRKRLDVLRGRSNYPLLEQYLSADVWRGHVREYTVSETVTLIESSGYALVQAKGFPYYLDTLKNPIVRLAYRLLVSVVPTLADCIFTVGRKSF